MRVRMASASFGIFALLAGAGCAAILGFDDTHVGDLDAAALDDSGTGLDGSNPADPKLAVSPTNLVIRRGSSLALTVNVQRGTVVKGAVVAHVDDLPANVAAAPVTILENETVGTVTITAASNAALGVGTAHLRTDAPAFATIELPYLVADPAGALDTTFDTDGFVTDATKGNASTFYALTTTPDGKILGAGVGGTGGWLARRYFDTGAADTVFNTATASLPPDGDARAVGVDSQNRILIAGASAAGILGTHLTVTRLLATGATDTTFGTGGSYKFSTTEGSTGSSAYALAIAQDDTVYVAGSRKESPVDETAVMIHLDAKGVLDKTFGEAGLLLVKKNKYVGVSIQPEGIVACGTDSTGNLTSYSLARFDTKGKPDKAFGSNGSTAFGLGFRADGYAPLVGGNLAVVGESTLTNDPKYTAGMTTGAGSQVWTRNSNPGTGAAFHGAASSSDGRLIAVGFTPTPASEARVERILADGGSDRTFGDAGASLLDTKADAGKDVDVQLWATRVQPDGRILAAGNRSNAGAVIYRLWP